MAKKAKAAAANGAKRVKRATKPLSFEEIDKQVADSLERLKRKKWPAVGKLNPALLNPHEPLELLLKTSKQSKKSKSTSAENVIEGISDAFRQVALDLEAQRVARAKELGRPLFQPNLALALCVGPDTGMIEDLASQLGSDLEEMRWDRGSGAYDSALIPELEKLVQEAGDPNGVDAAKLEEVVRRNAAPVGSPQAARFLEEIEAHGGD